MLQTESTAEASMPEVYSIFKNLLPSPLN